MPETTRTLGEDSQAVAQPVARTLAPPALAAPQVPARWTDAVATLLGSLGPRRWEDVEDAVDYVLTGTPATPPTFDGGRARERMLGGYETAHRSVLAGLADVPPVVAVRWARLLATIRPPSSRTMMPLASGLFESLLDDMAEVFDARHHNIGIDVLVLEDMAVGLGLPASSVLRSAFTMGPDSRDPVPSPACLALSAMHGYDAALLRHAAVIRVHIAQSDTVTQCRADRMLARAANTTLRVYGDVIDAMAASPDPEVRASTRPLVQRRDASRPTPAAEPTTDPPWARLGHRLSYVPQPRRA
ncbi:MAG: hypothetical protein FWH11_10960 [Micrococcales bacterium]|nr:hypothetical protein [Micrococcales bacterium]